ncbi:hypothetical protein AURDEDRAFT_169447 [Auricularia subglabra TFB-10046 SS5]|nr:hypothetical protein AURDEDRAFT_169447 [Auricularia subglabra TFB-10046 SS5]
MGFQALLLRPNPADIHYSRRPPHMWRPAPALHGDHVVQADEGHGIAVQAPSLLTLAALNELDSSSTP